MHPLPIQSDIKVKQKKPILCSFTLIVFTSCHMRSPKDDEAICKQHLQFIGYYLVNSLLYFNFELVLNKFFCIYKEVQETHRLFDLFVNFINRETRHVYSTRDGFFYQRLILRLRIVIWTDDKVRR